MKNDFLENIHLDQDRLQSEPHEPTSFGDDSGHSFTPSSNVQSSDPPSQKEPVQFNGKDRGETFIVKKSYGEDYLNLSADEPVHRLTEVIETRPGGLDQEMSGPSKTESVLELDDSSNSSGLLDPKTASVNILSDDANINFYDPKPKYKEDFSVSVQIKNQKRDLGEYTEEEDKEAEEIKKTALKKQGTLAPQLSDSEREIEHESFSSSEHTSDEDQGEAEEEEGGSADLKPAHLKLMNNSLKKERESSMSIESSMRRKKNRVQKKKNNFVKTHSQEEI
jgi:hypothetical protein